MRMLGMEEELVAGHLDLLAVLEVAGGVAARLQDAARVPAEFVVERVVRVLRRRQAARHALERRDLSAARLDLLDGLDGRHVVDAGVEADLVEDGYASLASPLVEGLHLGLDVAGGDHVRLVLDAHVRDEGVERLRQHADNHLVLRHQRLRPLLLLAHVQLNRRHLSAGRQLLRLLKRLAGDGDEVVRVLAETVDEARRDEASAEDEDALHGGVVLEPALGDVLVGRRELSVGGDDGAVRLGREVLVHLLVGEAGVGADDGRQVGEEGVAKVAARLEGDLGGQVADRHDDDTLAVRAGARRLRDRVVGVGRLVDGGDARHRLDAACHVAGEVGDAGKPLAAQLAHLRLGEEAGEPLVPVDAVDDHRGVGRDLLVEDRAVLLGVLVEVLPVEHLAGPVRHDVVLARHHAPVEAEAVAGVARLRQSLQLVRRHVLVRQQLEDLAGATRARALAAREDEDHRRKRVRHALQRNLLAHRCHCLLRHVQRRVHVRVAQVEEGRVVVESD
mmetsp:Transcript_7255/g.30869  ORF Transcript_7255/g.30869 Transcript_7255/m.30869 type:complete len:504 (+) Transcript_7255:819-2330(+)